eukprot:UC4_evm1s733
MNAASLNPTEIILQHKANAFGVGSNRNVAGVYKLTSNDKSSEDSTVLRVFLNQEDLNNLKRMGQMCNSINNTFIVVSTDVALDMNNNALVAIEDKSALQARAVIEDKTLPIVEGFELDLNEGDGVLHIDFSEVVLGSSAKVDMLSLSGIDGIGSYQLTKSSIDHTGRFQKTLVSQGRETRVTIRFNRFDGNEIKRRLGVSYSYNEKNIVLSTGNSFITDANFNENMKSMTIINDFPVKDNKGAAVIDFEVDMNEGILVLFLDEPVKSLLPEKLSLASAKSGVVKKVKLNSSTVSNIEEESTGKSQIALGSGSGKEEIPIYNNAELTVNVTLSEDDLNAIKAEYPLGSSNTTTFILIEKDSFLDTSNNFNVAKLDSLQCRKHRKDEKKPFLRSFTLDMDNGRLRFTFSEVVNGTSFSARENVVITGVEGKIKQTLNGGHVLDPKLGLYVELEILEDDLNTIKRSLKIANNKETTFALLKENSVFDIANNGLLATVSNVPCKAYEFDERAPALRGFSLNMTLRVMVITFSEPVRGASLVLEKVSLSSSKINPLQTNLRGSSMSPSKSIDVNETTTTIMLGDSDFNEIQRLDGLCISGKTCYLSLAEDAILDMSLRNNGNHLTQSPLTANPFTPDTLSPRVVGSILDMNRGFLNLTFSETVRSNTLGSYSSDNFLGVEISNGNLGEGIALSGERGSMQVSQNGVTVSVKIGDGDLNALKAFDGVASSPETAFLSVKNNAIKDMVGNPVDILTLKKIPEFKPDTTPPQIVQFFLDMNQGIVNLKFSETINFGSLNATKLQLMSRALHNETISFTEDSFSFDTNPKNIMEFLESSFDLGSGLGSSEDNGYRSTGYSTTLKLQISHQYLNALKAQPRIAKDCFLTVSEGAWLDMNGIPSVAARIVSDAPEASTNVIPDTEAPSLTNYDIDMNTGTIKLSFSETVELSTLRIDDLSFVSSDLSAPVNLTSARDCSRENCTEGTVVVQNQEVRSDLVVLNLGAADLDAIKLLVDLCTVKENSNLYALHGFVKDTSLHGQNNALAVVGRQPNIFIPDTSAPELIGLDLDMNSGGKLTLSFSEVVKAESIDLTRLSLRSYQGTEAHTFYGPQHVATSPMEMSTRKLSKIAGDNAHTIIVELGIDDMNQIKKFSPLGTKKTESLLYVSPGVARDMANNLHNTSEKLSANEFQKDITRPVVLRADLDMNKGVVSLEFSETVNPESFQFGEVGEMFLSIKGSSPITSSSGSDTDLGSGSGFDVVKPSHIKLIGDVMINELGPKMLIKLNDDSLNRVKADESVGTKHDDSIIVVESQLISDTSEGKNKVVEKEIKVQNYTPDTTSPKLLEFSVNMNSSLLTLHFNEVVDPKTFNPSGFVLRGNQSESFHLRNSVLQSDSGNEASTYIYVLMTRNESNEIKKKENLFVSKETSSLDISESAIKDMADQAVAPSTMPIMALEFFDDKTRPTFTGFSFDADKGVLVIEFYETVDVSSINQGHITLQRSRNPYSEERFSLATSVVSKHDDTHVTVQVSNYDLNELKKRRIGLEADRTFLALSNKTVSDMASLNLVDRTLKIKPEDFRADETKPELLGFVFDANAGRITLTFSETVAYGTFEPSGLGLQSHENRSVSGSQFYDTFSSIKAGTKLLSMDGPVQVIELHNKDLNAIKAKTGLATARNDTFLTLSESIFKDASGNSIQGNLDKYSARQANLDDGYINDTTPPKLLSFNLSMSAQQNNEDGTALLTLSFSETVQRGTLAYQRITIANKDGTTTIEFHGSLPESEFYGMEDVEDGDVLSFRIDTADSNKIKKATDIGTKEDNTYFVVKSGLVSDMAGVAIEDSLEFVRASDLRADEIAPKVKWFEIDLNEGTLTLTFDETIRASAFDPRELTVMNDVENADRSYKLSGSAEFDGKVFSHVDSTEIKLTFLKNDLDEIKRLELCGKATPDSKGGSCYISLSEWLARDMSPLVRDGYPGIKIVACN